jgi:hypothetical protein
MLDIINGLADKREAQVIEIEQEQLCFYPQRLSLPGEYLATGHEVISFNQQIRRNCQKHAFASQTQVHFLDTEGNPILQERPHLEPYSFQAEVEKYHKTQQQRLRLGPIADELVEQHIFYFTTLALRFDNVNEFLFAANYALTRFKTNSSRAREYLRNITEDATERHLDDRLKQKLGTIFEKAKNPGENKHPAACIARTFIPQKNFKQLVYKGIQYYDLYVPGGNDPFIVRLRSLLDDSKESDFNRTEKI